MALVEVDIQEWSQWPEPGQLAPAQRPFFDGCPEAKTLARELTRSGVLEVCETRQGPTFSSSSYVGSIGIGPYRVNIRPKIANLKLVRLLRYAYGLRDLRLYSESEHNLERMVMPDILVAQLASEVKELMARGLRREYKRTSEDLLMPHGRLDMKGYVQCVAKGGAELTCEHYPRTLNSLVNRILLAGMTLARDCCNTPQLRTELGALAAPLADEVESLQLSQDVFELYYQTTNRLLAAYGPSIRIIELLYRNRGTSFVNTRERDNAWGFLFDMNMFFQALLGRFFRDHSNGLTIREEHAFNNCFSYKVGHNPLRRNPPIIRPDFIVEDQGRVRLVLDAKYRDLWRKLLPRDMLYQLTVYSLATRPQQRGEAVILYPATSRVAQDMRISINHPTRVEELGQVVLRPVDLSWLDSILGLRGDKYLKEARKYCSQLLR